MVYVHSMTDKSFREIAGNTFLGKKTAKGYVIRELEAGRTKNEYFIYDQGGGNLAAPKRMLHGGVFDRVTDQEEIERVMFFARRAIAQFGD